MAETLKPISLEEIQASVARGEESKWNVGPDGNPLSAGYTMNDAGEVVWVGEGPEPTEEVDNSVDSTLPLRTMFDYVSSKNYYTNSYEEFEKKYASEEEQDK